MSETDQAKLDAAESIGVTAAVNHLRETNAPSISERVIQAFLCSKPDAEATRLANTAPKLLEACNQARIWLGNHGNDDIAAEVHDFICAAITEAEGH